MDRPFLGRFKRITNVDMLLFMTAALIIWMGYLTADIQYNRTLSMTNQQNLALQNSENHNQTVQIKRMVERQGNLSANTRNQLLAQFSYAAEHGGFATNASMTQNHAILGDMNASFEDMNDSFQALNLKLDKLLNHTK